MPNMSYCKFRNTYQDMVQCWDGFEDDVSEDEQRARLNVVRMSAKFVNAMGGDVDIDELIATYNDWFGTDF